MQAEYFDRPERTPAELRSYYEAIGRVNRLTRFERPFRLWLPRILGQEDCKDLSALDLGAGDGLLGQRLSAWAKTRGWSWTFTNLDLCPFTSQLDQSGRHVIGSVTDLPFADASFDIVVATTMTHHLSSDADVIAHFREAARTARKAVMLCDMHRNIAFLAALWLLLLKEPRHFRGDGVLSVRRGWRAAEWQRLAMEAGLTHAKVWTEHATRVLLVLKK